MASITGDRYALAHETNGLSDGAAYHRTDRSEIVELTDPRLAKVTRLRLIGEAGFPMWDVSYCHGILKSGTEVRVWLPYTQFNKRRYMAEIIEMCRELKVYGKGLGIFEAISTLD